MTYQFKVQAVNLSGTAASEAVEVTLPAGPPDPPELTVIPGHEMVTLSWTPGSDNGSAIERHELRYSADGGNTWNPDWTAEPPREQIIRNLLNETAYTFQMRAKNAVGYSTVAEVTVTPQHPILGPTALSSAENSEDRLATYRFSAPSDLDLSEVLYGLGLSDIDDSGVFELDNQGGLSFQDAPDFEAPATADRGNLYAVWLRAAPSSEGGGEGVRVEPPPTFLKRVEVTVTNVDEPGRVELSSTEPKVGDRLTAELTDPDKGVEDVDWRWQALPPGTRSTHPPGPGASTASSLLVTSEHIGLTLSAQVTYVDGESEDANDRKSAQSAATAPVVDVPSAPRNLEAAAGNARVDLRWDPPLTDNGSALTGYVVRHSADGGANWMSETLAVTRHTVRDLTNGTEYSFEVRAVNGAGEGASASDTATPARPDTPGRVEWSTTQPRVGQELTPTLIDPDNPALAEARWRWRRQRWSRSDDGDSLAAPVPGSRSGESKIGVIARTRQYTPQVSDLHQWLWVEVTYTDDYTDDSGRHRVSATTSRAVGPGPPCAPANLKAAPGDGQVTLTWEAGCVNGQTIDRYQYRRLEARKWVRVPGDGSARRQQVEGLTNGEAHTFEVRARNGQGWGPAAQATATPAAAESPPPPPPPPPLTVTYGASSYSAQEGGEAATVTVRLSPSASEALSIPITVNPPSGDFTVAGLTDGALSFAPEADEATFTITADQDDDTVDETVLLGFGDLPEEVSAGTPASATVTLFDDDVVTPVVSLSTTTPQVGQRMTATLVDVDGSVADTSWQWQRRADAGSGWVPIERSARYPIAATSRYTPVAADAGKQLRATVSYTDAHGPGSAQSAATDAVTWPPLTVTYGDSTYSASEGGAAATLTVRLSAEAEQLVKIPITRDPASGDYTVTWPGVEDTLSFSGSTTSQSFTVTATEDDDEDDETVLVGFGALPERVEAGTPASATVTLVDDTDHPGTVRLSTSSPEVGQRMTATLTDVDGGLEAVAWQWQRRADAGSAWVPIERSPRYPIVDLSRYTPVAADRGKQLRATVGYTDGHGPDKSAQSAATSAVRPADTPGTVRLSTASPQVDRELTATLVDEDGYLRDISWRWERRSGPGSAWRDIERPDDRFPHADLSRYTPSSSEAGQQLRATVSYTDGHGPGKSAQSGETDPVQRPDRQGTVRLSTASPQVGRELTATLVDVDGGLEAVAWQWQRRADASSGWVPIERSARNPIAATSHYTPVTADVGQQLRATVGYTDAHGPDKAAASGETDPVQRPDRQGTVRLSTASPQVDRELTATLVDEDGYLRDISWRWERRSGPGSAWRDIERPDDRFPHADLSRYTPSSSEAGQQLRATVSYTDGHGPGKSAQSGETDPVQRPDRQGTVRLSTASPQVGRELTATLVDVDGGLEAVAWQWQRRADASSGWVPIERSARNPIAATSHYTPVTADRGQQLRATVGYTDAHGPDKAAASGETAPVVTVPSVPRDFTAEAGNRQVVLSWRAPVSDGGLSLTGYEYRRRAGSGSWSGWTGVGTNTTRTVTGLSNGTRYRFEVRARNAAGAGAAASASATPVQPNRAPYFTSGPTSVSFAENGSGPVGRYTARDPDGDAITWSRTGTEASAFQLEGTGTTRTLTFDTAPDYEAGRSYQVTVEVSDGSLQAERTVRVTVTDEPEPPEPPSGVRVSAPDNMGHERLEVSWTAPDNRGRPALSGNDVHYCKTNEVFFCDSYNIWSSLTVGGSATGTLLTGLSSHTGYTVRVRARNAEGTSGWSARATGRTRSAAAKALAGQLARTGMKGLAALAAPNPFNSSTTLYFQLTETGEASLVIYSLAGQVVKTLIPNRTLKAGIHQVDWEGRDEQGRPVAAGVYLYRLAAGDKALVRKMTLLR